jgi:hypothetical protein
MDYLGLFLIGFGLGFAIGPVFADRFSKQWDNVDEG